MTEVLAKYIDTISFRRSEGGCSFSVESDVCFGSYGSHQSRFRELALDVVSKVFLIGSSLGGGGLPIARQLSIISGLPIYFQIKDISYDKEIDVAKRVHEDLVTNVLENPEHYLRGELESTKRYVDSMFHTSE